MGLVIALLPAALTGYLAGHIMSGGGYGPVANVLLGLGGGIVGNLLLSVVGVNVGDNLIENIAVGVVGAVVLVWLGRVVGRR
ncbi:MAG: GlsB/YeaQ/YmgE family stress response membrane protein [Anaerolineae bacterium]|nr:GlsB/YeaQ/YmgE family stress response membrane protein [Anaerolineae bacterium]